MKAGLLAIAALSAIASAQPHRRHQQLHEQRDVVVETAYQTQIEYATVTAPAAIVYVDQNGKPIEEAEPTSAPAAAAPAAAPVANNAAAVPVNQGANSHGNGVWERPSDNTQPAVTTTAAPELPAYTPPAVAPTSEAAPAPVAAQPQTSAAVAPPAAVPEQPAYSAPAAAAPSPSAAAPATGGSGLGITYSPYNSDNSCKSASQVKTDIDGLQGGHQLIRLYGVDCNQIQNVKAAAKPLGYKLFLGIYDVTNAVPEAAQLISAVGGDWSSVDTVSVGNEGVNNGQYSVAEVGIAVAAVKTALILAGYTGPVVTVDTFTAIINNPGLCGVGDYVAANCHAYFDGGITSDKAGDFVLSQAQRVSKACGGKKTVITESGWPSQGDSNQKAVASPADQAAAIDSLSKAFSSNLILFNAYNDGWKKDTAATFNVEKHWGIWGNAPSS